MFGFPEYILNFISPLHDVYIKYFFIAIINHKTATIKENVNGAFAKK